MKETLFSNHNRVPLPINESLLSTNLVFRVKYNSNKGWCLLVHRPVLDSILWPLFHGIKLCICIAYKMPLRCNLLCIFGSVILTSLLAGDYLQNHCSINSTDCMACEDRLPGCINLPDGHNPFPGRAVSEYYVKCFRNRTVSVEACQVSLYDQKTRECSSMIDGSKTSPFFALITTLQ